jgi:hypothetical protein
MTPILATAQIGIGTSSPHASAKLQVDASASGNAKGFLPPRVALTGTTDVATISSPATGLLIFNTANVTGASGVTPGYYFYDGTKWQRLINQQPDATVEFSVNTDPNTAGTTFDPTGAAATNVIYVSTINGSQWTYNGSSFVTYTPPASSAWYASGGTTDAGSNKTGSIYRSGKVGIGGSNTPNATLDIRTNPTSASDPGAGFLGIGTTSSTASAGGAGALRYNTTSGGILQYSNGSDWNTLTSTVQKTVVTGYFSGTYSAGGSTLTCTETSDANNAFSSNIFTAPRTGLYLITANMLSTSKDWDLREEFNISFNVGGTDVIISTFFSQAAITGTFGGTTISAVVSLTANQTASFKSYNSVRGYSLYYDKYNRFSITEL